MRLGTLSVTHFYILANVDNDAPLTVESYMKELSEFQKRVFNIYNILRFLTYLKI